MNVLDAQPSWPDLYGPRPYPYYIIAPGYQESSQESVAIHYLCHALNLIGQEAHLVGSPKTKSGLRTPTSGEAVKSLVGDTYIAIYPETVEGNPLYAPITARYIFDESTIFDGTELCASSEDLFFYQNTFKDAADRPVDGFLSLPLVDVKVFSSSIEITERKRNYLFLGTHSESDVDFSVLPEDIEVLLPHHAYTEEELVHLFRHAAVFYSYTACVMSTRAILCGCPVVLLSDDKLLEKRALSRLGVGSHGWTLENTPQGLADARASITEARDIYAAHYDKFWQQLNQFICATQTQAQQFDKNLKLLKKSKLEITNYLQWREFRRPSAERVLLGQAILQANQGKQHISILLCDASSEEDLQRTLESIALQTEPPANIWLATKRKRSSIDSELDLKLIPEIPAKAFQEILAAGNASCLWLMYGGDQLHPHALQTLALQRLDASEVIVWYSDTEYVDEQGKLQPLSYPDFNLDLFRSYPYMGRSIAVELDKIQPYGKELTNTNLFGLDCIFRVIEIGGPKTVRRIPEVLLTTRRSTLAWAGQDKTQQGFTALLRGHLDRLGLNQSRIFCEDGLHKIDYLGVLRPKVSILMPTRDMFEVLRTAIDSLLARTSYPHYELILIDHNTQEAAAKQFLSSLENLGGNIKVLPWPDEFNYSAMINTAAQHASGELLLMIDNDIEIFDSDWLGALVNYAMRAEVAAVGPRLETFDGLIDQAGLLLGIHGTVGRLFRGMQITDSGYMRRLQAASNVSAVSSTCLMLRKAVFNELQGLDSDVFPNYYGDVDLCLRALKNGYLNIVAPESRLRHMGGATRLLTEKFGLPSKPSNEQNRRFYKRWATVLGKDPSGHPAYSRYSENLTLDLARARIPATQLPGRPLPGIMGVHLGWGGCGNYRLLQPLHASERYLLAEVATKHGDFNLADVALFEPTVAILQAVWNQDGIVERIQRARDTWGTRILMDFDDYNFNIPVHNAHKRFFPKDAAKKMRRAIEVCDGLIVSTQPLAEEMSKYHDNVRVMKNRLDPIIWQHLVSERNTGKKIRVGWAGGTSHTGDLMLIRDLIKTFEGRVEWVFMGMKPENVRCEYHAGVPFEHYPIKLASLNLDIAVVPLEKNRFNECKSNLRLIELGALGVPIICTDIEPYRCDLPVTRVRNRFQDWNAALEDHLNDLDAAYAIGDRLREKVIKDWTLDEGAAADWMGAWLGS